MSKIAQLRQFLIAANREGYASGRETTWKKEKDNSTTITFSKDDWYMHDNFFGGEPYGGRLVVFYKKKPVWIMIYYGSVNEDIREVNDIYAVLREALKLMPDDAPFRGPKMYRKNDYMYKNKWQGDLAHYIGKERIMRGKETVYQATYFGGLVDQRGGV